MMSKIFLTIVLVVAPGYGGVLDDPRFSVGNYGYRSNRFCYEWVNKHIPVSEPVTMCGDDDITWSLAYQQCKDQNLQMCYGEQICPSHEKENRFAIQPSNEGLMIPVANGNNQWVSNIYDGDMCKLHVGVTGGDNNVYKSWKGNFFCCPRCDLRRFWVGHTVTWDQANNFCKKQTMREKWRHHWEVNRDTVEGDPYTMHLCTSDQVCRGDDPRWMQNADGNNHWTPVGDSPNEWTQVSPSSGDVCQKYTNEYGGNKPAWGQDDDCEYPWKGYVFCCGVQPRHASPQYFDETAEDVGDAPADSEKGTQQIKAFVEGASKSTRENGEIEDVLPWYPSNDELREIKAQMDE